MEEMMKTFLVKNPPLLSILNISFVVISQAEHLVSVLKFHPIYIVRGPKFAAVQESSPFVFPYASRNI